MATYKEIKGVTVQTRDEDPVVNAGSWSSGGSLNTGRSEIGGGGSQTSGAAAGGRASGSEPTLTLDVFEQYNGTSWSEATEINTEKRGTQVAGTANTALLIWGGNVLIPSYTTQTESWNGSAWTEVNDLNSAKGPGFGGVGTTTAAIAAGSYPPTNSETWDGTSWTEVNNVNNARVNFGVWGRSTSALIGGGLQQAYVETWDGTSWTETTDLSNNREGCIGQGTTTSTSGFITGGSYDPVGYLTKTESWNGSAWTEIADLATAKVNAGGSGSNTAALVTGGAQTASPTYSATSEEFSFPPPTSSILTEGDIFLSGGTTLKGFGKAAGIPAATWSSGGSLNTGRFGLGAAGSQTANLVFAGGIPSPPQTNITESYNGTSWTEVNDMQRSTAVYLAGTGTQTAALGMAGENTTVRLSVVESWDGTNWTEIADVNTARGTAGAAGTQTAAFLVGGDASPGAFAGTELWNGSSWTEVNNLNTARNGINATMGTQTEALVAGGYQHRTVVESWDGTSWTETTDINTGRGYSGGSGSQTFALVSGGQKSPSNTASANTEFWNGSSWTEVNDLSTARMYVGGSPTGSAASALITGGHPPYYTSTEEWTADATLSTVTVS